MYHFLICPQMLSLLRGPKVGTGECWETGQVLSDGWSQVDRVLRQLSKLVRLRGVRTSWDLEVFGKGQKGVWGKLGGRDWNIDQLGLVGAGGKGCGYGRVWMVFCPEGGFGQILRCFDGGEGMKALIQRRAAGAVNGGPESSEVSQGMERTSRGGVGE